MKEVYLLPAGSSFVLGGDGEVDEGDGEGEDG